MYKKYKRLVHISPDVLAKFSDVNLSLKRKKFGLICFPRICLAGLIYCDEEPLWLLNVIEDYCYFLGLHIENTSWKVLAYGIYARVVDVSEIERVSAANK